MLDLQEDKLHNGVPEECHSIDHQLTTLLDSIYQTNKVGDKSLEVLCDKWFHMGQ